MRIATGTFARRLGHICLISLVSAGVLVMFLRPDKRHVGINGYERALFVDMVVGRAYRPFVYRVLLSSIVQVVWSVTPESLQLGISTFVQEHGLARRAFAMFGWEISAAYPYLLACILMWLSLSAFSHVAARFVLYTCAIPETQTRISLLAVLMLVGLPLFFRYTSYVYDPPQLFLFTLALFCLARGDITPFLFAFVLVCVNKETAVLLVPICWLVCRRRYARGTCLALVAGLMVVYVATRGAIVYVFRQNPGSFVEFHLQRNIRLLTEEWDYRNVLCLLVLFIPMLYKWRQKAFFLRFSLVCVLVPLVGLALLLGYVDEWRGYYEAYPIMVALLVDSLIRIGVALGRKSHPDRRLRPIGPVIR